MQHPGRTAPPRKLEHELATAHEHRKPEVPHSGLDPHRVDREDSSAAIRPDRCVERA